MKLYLAVSRGLDLGARLAFLTIAMMLNLKINQGGLVVGNCTL